MEGAWICECLLAGEPLPVHLRSCTRENFMILCSEASEISGLLCYPAQPHISDEYNT